MTKTKKPTQVERIAELERRFDRMYDWVKVTNERIDLVDEELDEPWYKMPLVWIVFGSLFILLCSFLVVK